MKYSKFIVVLLIVILVSGCSLKSSTKTCEVVSDQSTNGYKITTKYVIHSKGDVVNKVEQTDTVETNKKDLLDFYKREYEAMYKKYNKTYKGYTFEVKVDGDKVVSKATIDYNKFNRKKYIEDNTGLKKYVNKKSYFTTDGIVKMYQNIGATCK